MVSLEALFGSCYLNPKMWFSNVLSVSSLKQLKNLVKVLNSVRSRKNNILGNELINFL